MQTIAFNLKRLVVLTTQNSGLMVNQTTFITQIRDSCILCQPKAAKDWELFKKLENIWIIFVNLEKFLTKFSGFFGF